MVTMRGLVLMLWVLSELGGVHSVGQGWDWRCGICRWGADAIVRYHRNGLNPQDALNLVEEGCQLLGVYPGPVCRGMVNSVGGQLFRVLDMANDTLTSGDICGMMLGPKCSTGSSRNPDWTLDIPSLDQDPGPCLTGGQNSQKTYQVVHLSDPHVQLNYTIGAAKNCHYPVCCMPGLGQDGVTFGQDGETPGQGGETPGQGGETQGQVGATPDGARRWGEYSCDLPPWTLDRSLADLASRHRGADYVILTGDFPAHDVWLQSRSDNLKVTRVVAEVLRKHFPDTMVLPAVGNHEAFPVNIFPDPRVAGEPSPHWLYSSLAKYFSHWLPVEQQESLSLAGYFVVQVKPGLRVLSVNSNFCNNLNVWLLPSPRDPVSQLTWLAGQLLKAEIDKQKVHIISHIPPGSTNCLDAWSHQYARIIRRFCKTVTGQFFGHTHFDEFSVLFKEGKNKETMTNYKSSGDNTTDKVDYTEDTVKNLKTMTPVSVAYISPSLTPHHGLNPAYRVYEMDSLTHQVTDHTTFYLDLEQANGQVGPNLNFTREYSARAALNMSDLSPTSWDGLVSRLQDDEGLWGMFYQLYSRGGPMSKRTCNRACKMDILCRLVTFDRRDPRRCSMLRRIAKERQPRNWWSWL